MQKISFWLKFSAMRQFFFLFCIYIYIYFTSIYHTSIYHATWIQQDIGTYYCTTTTTSAPSLCLCQGQVGTEHWQILPDWFLKTPVAIMNHSVGKRNKRCHALMLIHHHPGKFSNKNRIIKTEWAHRALTSLKNTPPLILRLWCNLRSFSVFPWRWWTLRLQNKIGPHLTFMWNETEVKWTEHTSISQLW